jgi:Zn-dependent peptidase ImmA (M78 family)
MGAMPNKRALQAAREQRGLALADAAKFATIAPDRLREIEGGTRVPSRKQVERLAEMYGVPLYTFFVEGVPNLPPPPTDFRRREPGPAAISPRGLQSILVSERIGLFTKQLAIELKFDSTTLLSKAELTNDPVRTGQAARIRFNEWLSKRRERLAFTGRAEDQLMGALRIFIEIQGTIVNSNDAPIDDFLGFFLEHDASFPVVFVNRTLSSRRAQLFTLAHEYGHALLGKSGISNPFEARNATERWCNVFAAEFLAPMRDFTALVETLPREVRSNVREFVSIVSARTYLSKHATAIRLVESNYLSRAALREWRSHFERTPGAEKVEEKEAAPPGGGGVPHAKRLSEIGHLPVFLAFKATKARFIDAYDVSAGLGLSQTLQERAYSLAARRIEAALG